MAEDLADFLSGDMFKISILMLVASVLIIGLASRLRKLLRSNPKTLIYLGVLLVVFAATGLLSSPKVFNTSILNSFIASEVVFFIAGIANIFILRKYFEDLSKDKSNFHYEFLFSLFVLGVALVGFFLVVSLFKSSFAPYFISAGIPFLIPFLVVKMYEYVVLIPPPAFKKWFYPIGETIVEPESEDMENPLLISLMFKKQTGDKKTSDFRLKAPRAMEFGKFFYYFVHDYNELHPNEPIAVMDKTGITTGWNFYYKPNWWKPVSYIDTSQSMQFNGIKEDSKIIAKRVV